MTRSRSGFVLLVLLPALVVAGAVVAAVEFETRGAMRREANVSARLEAEWLAEGCALEVRFQASRSMAEAPSSRGGADVVWRHLDREVASMGAASECSWALTPGGTRMNLTRLDEHALATGLVAAGHGRSEAGDLAAAILDWVDADTVPRPRGAEASWYDHAGRPLPANRPLQSLHELQWVRGGAGTVAHSLLSLDNEPINLRHAPVWVLATLPGATPALINRWLDARARDLPMPEIEQVAMGLPADARRELDENLAALRAAIVPEPPSWHLSVEVARAHGVGVRLEQRLVRAIGRIAVQGERRTWR
ncbi:MAG: general secretion pathway protein GspK [Gemmatimonadaceae bacterium]|nr:general secretion pathway protein GspK [Gemmatimonadaceae bacterium]